MSNKSDLHEALLRVVNNCEVDPISVLGIIELLKHEIMTSAIEEGEE
jgi:hypothetical protein